MEEVYTVKVRAQPDAARLYPSERRYSASTVGGLGAVHLALAATCILLAGLDLAQPADFTTASTSWTGRYGGGAWLGIAAALAGLTGILAWRRWYIDNNIRWFFICSCVAGFAAILCLAVTSAALAITQEEWSSTRMRVLTSLRELQTTQQSPDGLMSLSLHLAPEVAKRPEKSAAAVSAVPLYSVSQNTEHFEVQRALRNAEINSDNKDSTPQVHSLNEQQRNFTDQTVDRSHIMSITSQETHPISQIPYQSSESQNVDLQANHDVQISGHSSETIVPADETNHYNPYDVIKSSSNVPMLPNVNVHVLPAAGEVLETSLHARTSGQFSESLHEVHLEKAISQEHDLHEPHIEHDFNDYTHILSVTGLPNSPTNEQTEINTSKSVEETIESQSTKVHHISSRQAISEDQFVDGNDEEREAQRDDYEEHHLRDEEDAPENLRNPPVDAYPNQMYHDGNSLYLHRNNEDASANEEVKKVLSFNNETNINETGQNSDKSVFEKHLLSNRGSETRFVIAINLLVASVLEIAWSILSAKIAWKGMKNGYPEDGPSRTDNARTVHEGEQLKDKGKVRNKKIGSLRKPDIISNHDGGKSETRRKPCKEERRDPSLPLQESTMEYQERVRRFLASNNVAIIEAGME